MHRLQRGTTPAHSPRQAREVAEHQHTAPERITRVVAAVVSDPTGIKLGLPITARVMWAIYGYDVYPPDTDGPVGRPLGMTAGTATHLLALVDDETLQPGGSFGCQHWAAKSPAAGR